MTPFIRSLSRAALLSLLLAAFAGASPPAAQTQDAPAKAAAMQHGSPDGGQDERPSGGAGILSLLPPDSATHHTIQLGRNSLAYSAEAGTLPIRNAGGKTEAKLFYTAYTADQQGKDQPGGEHPQRDRPITFVFNGGPGAASAYLNIGALGPRIVDHGTDGSIPPPPARLTDNPDTWLAFTDLVFVDPVGTGYSRAADPKNDKDFWSVNADRETMAAFIRLYLAQKGRTTSPVFLTGESYGGFRAALLAKSLPDKSGVALSGVVMISPALDLSLLFGHQTAQILPSALALPSEAAVNFAAKGVSDRAEMQKRLQPVEDYALGGYLTALAAGPEATRDRASAKVADVTGLPLDLVKRRFGAVSLSTFARMFDQAKGQLISRYDGTVAGPDIDPGSPFSHGPDPVLDRMGAIWTSAFVNYVRNELGFKTDITYRLLDGEISRRWDYGNSGSDQGYADAMQDLQEARAYNPALRILIAQGYTDLVTPYLASRYLVGQLPPLAGAAPIETEDYLGGHMLYLRPDSRHALMSDVRALYEKATASSSDPGVPTSRP
ncbi:S10 family peptidase [Jiella sp. M17.18]|uniref:S10 family peptidase n=1 Tax=Jiella sp. M17.18 TaxID=3234247 RepID=UPI0034E0304F